VLAATLRQCRVTEDTNISKGGSFILDFGKRQPARKMVGRTSLGSDAISALRLVISLDSALSSVSDDDISRPSLRSSWFSSIYFVGKDGALGQEICCMFVIRVDKATNNGKLLVVNSAGKWVILLLLMTKGSQLVTATKNHIRVHKHRYRDSDLTEQEGRPILLQECLIVLHRKQRTHIYNPDSLQLYVYNLEFVNELRPSLRRLYVCHSYRESLCQWAANTPFCTTRW